MFITIAALIFVLPMSIYYFYARPSRSDLLPVTFIFMLCNVFILMFLLNRNSQHKISAFINIDYSATASISREYDSKDSASNSGKKERDNLFARQKTDTSENAITSADIICSNCDVNAWGAEPDFSNLTPLPNFLWPVQGKIIKSFHSTQNEGVNIAIPFGTDVETIDDG